MWVRIKFKPSSQLHGFYEWTQFLCSLDYVFAKSYNFNNVLWAFEVACLCSKCIGIEKFVRLLYKSLKLSRIDDFRIKHCFEDMQEVEYH